MKFEIPFLAVSILSVILAAPLAKTAKPAIASPVQQHTAIIEISKPVPPVPPAALAPVLTGCAAYLPIIQQYTWNADIAQAIMRAENGACDPSRDNAGLNYDGSVDYGLFQVNSVHADMVGGNLGLLKDPATNIRVAHQIYTGSGWYAWTTYKNGAYLKYL